MKIMKKSTKRFCLKLAASILSTTLVASIALPMNVLAVADTTEHLPESSTISSSSVNYSESIVREIEEERNEFSKTFLMADGTYYTYVSPVAIHEFIEDKWVDISDSLRESPATISEAEENVKDYVETVETVSNRISMFSVPDNPQPITVNCVGNASQSNSNYILPTNSALIIKPTGITKFSMYNKILLSATFNVNITTNQRNNNRPLYLKNITSEADSTSYTTINSCKNIYYKLYNNSKTEYSFDVTDIYSKWERGLADNHGVALVGSGIKGTGLEITSIILSITYKDVSANDSSFTYHTLDLGKAGVLSINDVTNAFKLEQTIAGIDCSLLPVTLTKTIDSAKFSLDSYANVSSEWNYNYGLSVAGPYATLILPQGTIIDFKQPENATTINNYQVWEQCRNRDYVDGASFHITRAALESTTIGDIYQDCYVDINGIEYWFNSTGRIESIKKADKELNIEYAYFPNSDQLVINKLTDAIGNQYCISYSTYNVNNTNYIYANKIEVKDSENQYILFDNTPLVINILNTVSDNIITSTFSYPSEADAPINVSYSYDLTGKLLYIQSADGTITELHYKSEDNTYLTGYTQKKNNEVINTFTITSNDTFERVFEGTFIQKETQRYSSDFQLITYYYGNNVMGINYNENSIDSYAIKTSDYSEIQNLIDNGSFERPLIDSMWEDYSTASPYYDSENKRVKIENNNAGTVLGLCQTIEEDAEIPNSQNLHADTTYVFSAEVVVDDSIPSNDYALKATIELFDPNTDAPLGLFELPFDVSLLNETQVRLCSFKSDVECAATVSIYAEGQLGRFYLDNVYVYEAVPEDGSATIPGVSMSNPAITTITEDGVITKEYISDGTTYMLQKYEHAEDTSKVITTLDFNGIYTYFDYAPRTSKLAQKGYALKSNGFIENPISYSYNDSGLLSVVKQIINNVEPEITTHLAQYTYDSAERVTSVTNNSYSYIFTYDKIGNITNIKKEATVDDVTQTNNLVDYNYSDNNIGSIVYSNGYKIDYTYDEESGEIYQIICYKEKPRSNDETNTETKEYDIIGSYTYSYSNGNIIETLIDNVDLAYDVKIAYTDTGIDIYHNENLIYSKSKSANNTVEKFISSASGSNLLETFTQTNVTETAVGTNTELYSTFSGSKYSSFSSDITRLDFSGSNNIVKDYFGRISSKYYTLESDIINAEAQSVTQSAQLSLTHNYSYKAIANDPSISGTRTSNLINSVSNIISAESTEDGTTIATNLNVSYNYIYDNRGNIKFVYLHNPEEGEYYLENCYQYDEANQITAELGSIGSIFYSYDNNGNIIEKLIDGEINVSGVNSDIIDELGVITDTNWNNFNWSVFENMAFSISKPKKKITYNYDGFQRLIEYAEKSYTYDSNGNVTEKPIIDLEIPYDNYGNPLKYIGESTVLDKTITADLNWNGNQLESAIIYDGNMKSQKISFTYDENGYRINKTTANYTNGTEPCTVTQQTNYVWENGNLKCMQPTYIDNNNSVYMYTNVLYDNTGVPYAITTPTGLPYYFLRDSSNNIKGLISSNGELATYINYDAFGNFTMDVSSGDLGSAIINTLSAMYNPCTYKGYLYDYELGMYFMQNKCYSPKFCRFLNETSLETLTEPKDEPLDINLHLFCNNNSINNFDTNAEWDRYKFTFTDEQSYGIQVEMSKAFLSRPFCTLYASKIISDSGSWDYLNGRSCKNMGIERIASNLFARCVGNYAESAVNRVNATWGDGWIVSNRNSGFITITEKDHNCDKYLKIWLAAPSIKAFATSSGIYITL